MCFVSFFWKWGWGAYSEVQAGTAVTPTAWTGLEYMEILLPQSSKGWMTGVGGPPCAAVLDSHAQDPLPFDLFTSLFTWTSMNFFFTDLWALYSQACI